jgi:hypothetical protein
VRHATFYAHQLHNDRNTQPSTRRDMINAQQNKLRDMLHMQTKHTPRHEICPAKQIDRHDSFATQTRAAT